MSLQIFRGGLSRRMSLTILTLILTPVLALLAAALLLLNLAAKIASFRRKPAPAQDKPLSGLASIIILNWNGKALLAEGLPSVVAAIERDGRPHEIIVVDNGSSDGSQEFVRSVFPQIRLVELPVNMGFGYGNNVGVQAARHDVVVLLNNDMVVDPGFLRPLLDCFGPDTFAVSSQIYHQDPNVRREETGMTAAAFRRGSIDFAHRDVNDRELSRPCYPVLWAGGGSSAFHRESFLFLGGFNDVFSPAYFEDTDLSFQAWRAGWEVLFTPCSVVHHKHRASSSRLFTPSQLNSLVQRNHHLFLWKNIQSWPLLLSHCVFLPWNCYRLARDNGLSIWRSLFQAVRRLPGVLVERARSPFREARTDADIFKLIAAPPLYFSSRRTVRRADSQEPPRILLMTAYLPYLGRHAGAGRVYQLLKRLSQRYRITLLSFIEEEEKKFLPDLESMCEKVVAMPRVPPPRFQPFVYEPFKAFLVPEMEQAMIQCLTSRHYDLIQLEYTQMAGYAHREFGIPILLTKHEVDFAACARRARTESNLLRKLRWFYNYLQVLDRETSLQRRVDGTICVADPDMHALKRFCPSAPVYVISMGVDLEYFRPAETAASGNRLAFVGAFQHAPNIDAMLYFCRRILPMIRAQVPDVELSIIGSNPPPEILSLADMPGVRVTGSVPDIRPFMAECPVYIVPLRLGMGMRGKVLEAWGMAMPVVATSVACAGLRYRDGENLLLADDDKKFSDGVIMLLRDAELRRRIASEGRKTAEQFYSWDAIASQLDAIYQSYIGISPQL